MALYCGIDLHANNSYLVVTGPQNEIFLGQRLPNDLATILRALEPYREELAGDRGRVDVQLVLAGGWSA